jgi:thiamine pyrophosphokinase
MKLTIIANGTLNDIEYHKNIIKDSDKIICADGGANNVKLLDIIPDYVIGDMDSVDKETLEDLKNNNKTEVIIDSNQNKTDLELAIEIANSLNPTEIILIGAIGVRIDHTIANILSLEKLNQKNQDNNLIKIRLIDNKNEISILDELNNSIEIDGKKNDIVSIIALADVEGLTYQGLKWELNNFSAKSGWIGVCNKMISNKASVKLISGKILVIKSKD